jgi:hypothetical protein
MIVNAAMLAGELRKRKVGRPDLVRSLDAVNASTYVPGNLNDVPASFLVLAALSLGRPAADTRAAPG